MTTSKKTSNLFADWTEVSLFAFSSASLFNDGLTPKKALRIQKSGTTS